MWGGISYRRMIIPTGSRSEPLSVEGAADRGSLREPVGKISRR